MVGEVNAIWSRAGLCKAVCFAVALTLVSWLPACAGPNGWVMNIEAQRGSATIGAMPGAHDGWDGQTPADPYWLPYIVGVAVVLYREHGTNWAGETGSYLEDYESPIPPGGSKTWWDFYLWSHNYTPNPPNQIEVTNVFRVNDIVYGGPHYIGHLVIDQVPAGLTWTGPMDYWFDITTTTSNTFTLPIADETDPLQGTRFHLTVYAPEPSSLLALAAGVAGLGGFLLRRRRR